MEIHVTLNHGPLDIEIKADGEENYKKEIEDLLDIVEERVDSLAPPDKGRYSERDINEDDKLSSGPPGVDSPLGPLAENTDIAVNRLERIIHADENEESLPYLLIDDVDALGDTLPERQRTASLVILYTMRTCHNIEIVHGPKLKTALDKSDLSTNNMYKMRQGEGKSYFDHDGQGNSSKIGLRGPGRRKAREEIKRLVETLDFD